jgi:hypothetical protein
MVAATVGALGAEAQEMALKYSSITLLSLVGGFLAYISSGAYGADNELPRIILAMAFAVFFVIFLTSILTEELNLLLFVFGLYHLFFFILPGMVHLARNLFPFYHTSFDYNSSLYVAFLILLYAISSLLGVFYALSRRPRRSAQAQPSERPIRDKDLLIGALFLLVISLPCIAATGISIARRADGMEDFSDPSPIVLILTSLPSSAMFLCAILSFYIMRRRSFVSIIFFAFTGTLGFLLNYPLSLTRFILFERIIVLMYVTLDLSSVRLKKFVAVAAVLSIFTVFPTLDYFARGDTSQGLTIDPLGYMAESGDLDGLQSTLNVYEMVKSQGLSYGYQLLGAVLSYVPRTAWPTKPYSTGTSAAVFADYDFTNLSAPLISEIYVDFGMAGVTIIPFFVCWLIIALDRRAAIVGRERGRILEKFFLGGLIGYATIILRGSLISIISQIYLYMGLVWALTLICRRAGRLRKAGITAPPRPYAWAETRRSLPP